MFLIYGFSETISEHSAVIVPVITMITKLYSIHYGGPFYTDFTYIIYFGILFLSKDGWFNGHFPGLIP